MKMNSITFVVRFFALGLGLVCLGENVLAEELPEVQLNVSHQLVEKCVKRWTPNYLPIDRQIGEGRSLKAMACTNLDVRIASLDLSKKKIKLDLSGKIQLENGVIEKRNRTRAYVDARFVFQTCVCLHQDAMGLSKTLFNTTAEPRSLNARCAKFPKIDLTSLARRQLKSPMLRRLVIEKVTEFLNSNLRSLSIEAFVPPLVKPELLHSIVRHDGISIVTDPKLGKSLTFEESGLVLEVTLNEEHVGRLIQWVLPRIRLPSNDRNNKSEDDKLEANVEPRKKNKELLDFLREKDTNLLVEFYPDDNEVVLSFSNDKGDFVLTIDPKVSKKHGAQQECQLIPSGSYLVKRQFTASEDFTAREPIVDKVNRLLKNANLRESVFSDMEATYCEVEVSESAVNFKLKMRLKH